MTSLNSNYKTIDSPEILLSSCLGEAENYYSYKFLHRMGSCFVIDHTSEFLSFWVTWHLHGGRENYVG